MVVIPIKKHEKELLQRQLNNEKAILKDLEDTYKKALEDIDEKLAALLGRQDADLQHVIYQAERQKALRTQVQGILEQLQANEFESISEYLETCYEEGYIGAMYSLQQQGVPLMLPIDQEQVVAAIQTESKISEGLYTRLGKDVKELRKTISSEISRGIATAMPYADIARNIENASTIGLNRAKRIARTEGGRIQNKAAMDTMRKAKAIGADVVKRWSAFLDSRTRPSHVRVDHEVREIEERFSNGLMYPKDPSGRASEVVNCRCTVQEIARWALDDEETRMLGRTEDMTDKQLQPIANKLNIPVSELRKYSGQIIPVKAKDYDDFKRQYDKLWHYEGSDLQKEAEARIASYGKAATNKMAVDSASSNDWSKTAVRTLTKAEKSQLIQYADGRGVVIPDLKQFDGDPELLKAEVDTLAKMQTELPLGKKIVMSVSQSLPDAEFASTAETHITVNAKALRNREITERNIVLGAQFASSTVEDIVVHEYGHIIVTAKGNKGLEIAEKAYYNVFGKKAGFDELLDFLYENVSPYSSTFRGKAKDEYRRKYTEVISEVLAKNNSKPDDFTEEFVKLLKGAYFNEKT